MVTSDSSLSWSSLVVVVVVGRLNDMNPISGMYVVVCIESKRSVCVWLFVFRDAPWCCVMFSRVSIRGSKNEASHEQMTTSWIVRGSSFLCFGTFSIVVVTIITITSGTTGTTTVVVIMSRGLYIPIP